MFAICSVLVASVLAQAPAVVQPGRIAGRVTLEGASTPIAGVRVTLVPTAQASEPPLHATTDQEGRYVFDRVATGEYYIHIAKPGFASVSNPAIFRVAPGQRLDSVNYALQRGAVIAGRILDASGEPIAGVMVTAMERAWPGLPIPNRPVPLVPAPIGATPNTDDVGKFRVAGLAAGTYVIVATQQPSMMPGALYRDADSPPPPPARPHRVAVQTFYPGTTDAAAAQPIAVRAGAEIENIEFVLQNAPAFRISGIVVDEAGDPVGGAMVRLSSHEDTMFGGPQETVTARNDGHFDIDDVTAGTYQARAAIPITIGNVTTASWDTSGGDGFSRDRRISTRIAASVSDGTGGGSFTASTDGPPPANANPPSEVLVVDRDVTDLRVVTRRPRR